MVPGFNAGQRLFVCDKVPGFVPAHDKEGRPLDAWQNGKPPPDEYFRETSEGLEVWRHPLTLFEQDEKLWATWTRFRDTSNRDLTLAQRRRMSAFEVRLWLDACEYQRRKELAAINAPPPPPGSAARYQTRRSLAAAATTGGMN